MWTDRLIAREFIQTNVIGTFNLLQAARNITKALMILENLLFVFIIFPRMKFTEILKERLIYLPRKHLTRHRVHIPQVRPQVTTWFAHGTGHLTYLSLSRIAQTITAHFIFRKN